MLEQFLFNFSCFFDLRLHFVKALLMSTLEPASNVSLLFLTYVCIFVKALLMNILKPASNVSLARTWPFVLVTAG